MGPWIKKVKRLLNNLNNARSWTWRGRSGGDCGRACRAPTHKVQNVPNVPCVRSARAEEQERDDHRHHEAGARCGVSFPASGDGEHVSDGHRGGPSRESVRRLRSQVRSQVRWRPPAYGSTQPPPERRFTASTGSRPNTCARRRGPTLPRTGRCGSDPRTRRLGRPGTGPCHRASSKPTTNPRTTCATGC
jgi:hypothetical protein